MSTCDNENLNLTDLKDKIEDAIEKGGYDLANDNPTPISQADFTKPYIIDKPGKYILQEDIKVNFYPAPYDIFDVQSTGNDLFGFPAAIKITARTSFTPPSRVASI